MPEILHCGDESSAQNEPIRFLIYGSTGSGKTYSLKTLPEAMRPALILDTDRGTAAVRSDAGLGTIVTFDFNDQNGKPIMFEQVKAFLQEFHSGRAKLPLDCTEYKTVVLDSFTVLYSSILNSVLVWQMSQSDSRGHTKRAQIDDPPTLAEYGMIGHHGIRFLQALIQLNRNLIMICHETAKIQDSVTGVSSAGPALPKALATNFPRYFDEVLFAKATGQADSRQYVWSTQSSGMYEARSRHLNSPTDIKQDFNRYVRAASIQPSK